MSNVLIPRKTGDFRYFVQLLEMFIDHTRDYDSETEVSVLGSSFDFEEDEGAASSSRPGASKRTSVSCFCVCDSEEGTNVCGRIAGESVTEEVAEKPPEGVGPGKVFWLRPGRLAPLVAAACSLISNALSASAL